MAARGRRAGQPDWDPNKSDPEDETYGAPSRKRKHAPSSATPRKRSKKRRRDSDDEDISEDSDSVAEESFEAESDEEEDLAIALTTSGRPARGVARKAANYQEPDSDEEDAIQDPQTPIDDIEESEEDVKPLKTRLTRGKSLIVKLKTTPGLPRRRSSRSQTGGGSVKPSPTPNAGQRRSSRLSHDPEEPLVSLTDSGRREQVVRAGTRTPDAEPERPTRGGKQLPTTSTIIEASQETSNRSQHVIGTQNDGTADSDEGEAAQVSDPVGDDEIQMEIGPVIQESQQADDDEDEEDPISQRRRSSRSIIKTDISVPMDVRPSGRIRNGRKRGPEESSEFEFNEEEEEEDDDLHSNHSRSPQKNSQPSESESHGRRSRRIADKKASQPSQSDSDDVADELAEELDELKEAERDRKRSSKRGRRRASPILYDRSKNLRTRNGNQPDYRIINPELHPVVDDDDDPPIQTTSRRGGGGGGAYKSLFSTFGPFGAAGGPTPLFSGPEGQGATGGVDSDSSDDEGAPKPVRNIGGQIGMTPTTAPQNFLPQALNSDPAQQGAPGAPSNLGKVKDKKALADSDPLGVDPNVSFDEVGGLDNHVNQLKEMVMLPLLYPEIFQRFHTTPPRGVLFHGPPGTGKTLLARALAASVSSQGQKVTFYMRKGADALSKWVGEAERQLRLLFEQARQNQPSIIFFDEIDGLAPVRSSKQEQIHASIVATLLALMDGMDGRGQVIVIGATNRPDSVDPALRRPGRFDREFYFPLPNETARRAIIDIHTKGWTPPLESGFKDKLAQITKGYGGADLRALCTEAALNAVQGTYPQIYQSNQKLIIDPHQIKVLAKDFMISVNKMIPSSGRSAPSDAKPLEASVEPLLRDALNDIAATLDDTIPTKKPTTALEEAQYDTREDKAGFDMELMQQNFDQSRVFRPRLLIHGPPGMGQQYIGSALLNKFERLHVQSFDLSVLLGDSAASAEATVVRLFNEVRRHKPGVIYLPNVNTWYDTVGPAVVRLFASLLRSLPPNDPILVLGLMEYDVPLDEGDENGGLKAHPGLLKDLFGFSTKNLYKLGAPGRTQREEYFQNIIDMIKKKPSEFPDPANRRKRHIPQLQVAPPPQTPSGPSKSDLKSQKKADRHVLNLMKMAINPIMLELRNKYKRFRAPVIDPRQIEYLFSERDPNMVTTDIPHDQQDRRPYEIKKDEKGVEGLVEVLTGRFFYNLEIITIEKRLSNGYYKRPKDFLADIKRLAKDAKALGDPERTMKANELLANVEVDIELISTTNPALIAACEQVYIREKQREKLLTGQISDVDQQNAARIISNLPPHVSRTTEPSTGPVILGEPVPGQGALPPRTPPIKRIPQNSLSNGITDETQQDSKPQTNGSTDPLHADDVAMGNTEEYTGPQTTQRSALTPMAQNSLTKDYHNSASTTSSSQKPSDNSNDSSGRAIYHGSGVESQSNGVAKGDYPDFSTLQPASGGSQLPDTQGELTHSSSDSGSPQPQLTEELDNPFSSDASQPSSNSHPHAQQSQLQSQSDQQITQAQAQASMPPPTTPARSTSNINSLLNDNTNDTTGPPSETHPVLVLDTNHLNRLHEELVIRSSGCSVEQLEQVTAVMMDAIWRSRGDWNRSHVVNEVAKVFSEMIHDMEQIQGIGRPSQESRRRTRSELDDIQERAFGGGGEGELGARPESRDGVRSLWQ